MPKTYPCPMCGYPLTRTEFLRVTGRKGIGMTVEEKRIMRSLQASTDRLQKKTERILRRMRRS